MNKSVFINTGVFKVSDNGLIMFCPICKSKLNNVGDKELYTIFSIGNNEQPELTDTYSCPNKLCNAFKNGTFWDRHGDVYRLPDDTPKGLAKTNYTAINSNARKASIEIYKRDENFTLLNLFFVKFCIEFKYKGDDYGNVISKKPTLKIWIK